MMKTSFRFRIIVSVSFLLASVRGGQNVCVPRLDECVADDDCCGGMGCFYRPVPGNANQVWEACDLRACCTKDEWTCMADENSEFCNFSPSNCASVTCGGTWFEREPGMSEAVEGCAAEDCSLDTGATPCNRTNGMSGILLCHHNNDFCSAPQAWSRRCERLGNTCGSCSASAPTKVPTARPTNTPTRSPSPAPTPTTDPCSEDNCSLGNGATECTRSGEFPGILLCHNGADFCSAPQAWPRRCRDYGNTCGSCTADTPTDPTPAPIPDPTPAPVPDPTPAPVPDPTPAPVPAPMPSPTVSADCPNATYFPGDLTVSKAGLLLSTGLDARRLTTGGQKVRYDEPAGSQSTDSFHSLADGAGVIPATDDTGDYYYVSNSESSSSGGVGTIKFNANHEVIEYKRGVLSGTRWNCAGGLSPWGTWLSCEEDGLSGRVWEVDPNTGFTQQTNLVDTGGSYESVAFDDQDPDVTIRFFTTDDRRSGALVRYTPTESAANDPDITKRLSSAGGEYHFLVLNPSDGTFTWSSSRIAGQSSANSHYRYSEGIDVKDGVLYFVSKTQRELFILNLREGTYTKDSTVSGAFNNQPDQVGRILNSPSDVLYFCEDGGYDCDVHGRNTAGEYFTIIRGPGFNTETTGLAFSPDGTRMYVSFQGPSAIFQVWREDGCRFDGGMLDIKYHA